MDKKKISEIRRLFLEFFKSKNHLIRPSYPLVPKDDKSLLLINAGMAPLKSYFSGIETPPNKRMATCQKCIRTGDIENVGITDRHATFFEMLGNFSFGDYFKEEAILWGWEFVIEHLKMPVDKLWVTVYLEDEEAYQIWKDKIGIDEKRIVKLGKEHNFWEIGLGPCGPCSEIYFDRGPKYGCNNNDCKPGCECDRFVEFWNLVFTQFDKDEKGNYNLLPNPNIDTGMGLERVACIMQNVDSIFEIDTMKYILDEVCKLTNTKYNEDQKKNISLRIITDHIRSVVFMIGDGILPSNEGRGYVLRRLLRRAARHGKMLGLNESFLYKLINPVVDMYGQNYNELREKYDYIKKVVNIEEERFQETIHQGLEILNRYINELVGSKEIILKGIHAFRLYDTYGFPLELTKEILEEKGIDIDVDGFKKEMSRQKDRARKARTGHDIEGWNEDVFNELNKDITNEFEGYDKFSTGATVLAIIKDNKLTDELAKDDEAIVILDRTTFYPEGGGQVGDIGLIYNNEFNAVVTGTKRTINDIIYQVIKVNEGVINVGDKLVTKVNEEIRKATALNHTATHMLHKTLKVVLGEHVQQAGSLVTPGRLRFDFTHFEALTDTEISEIEKKVNIEIMKNHLIEIFETTYAEAKNMGAEALFGEKYDDLVRVVKTGDYSMELCGGTHVGNTSEIGMFIITNEGGISSGVRRIEAVTGLESYKYVKQQQNTIARVSESLKTPINSIANRVLSFINESREKDKEIEKLRSKLSMGAIDEILRNIKNINGSNILLEKVNVGDITELRKIGDELKSRIDSGVILLASEADQKVHIVALATKDMVKKGIHAGNLVKEAASITGGGGGGRPDMAQAGGKHPERIQDALNTVETILKNILNG